MSRKSQLKLTQIKKLKQSRFDKKKINKFFTHVYLKKHKTKKIVLLLLNTKINFLVLN
jgi:hypothetical protein